MRLLWNLKREEEEEEKEKAGGKREGGKVREGVVFLFVNAYNSCNIQVCDFANNLLIIDITVCYWIIASQLLVMSFSSV